jgi:hypothetical protein
MFSISASLKVLAALPPVSLRGKLCQLKAVWVKVTLKPPAGAYLQIRRAAKG